MLEYLSMVRKNKGIVLRGTEQGIFAGGEYPSRAHIDKYTYATNVVSATTC